MDQPLAVGIVGAGRTRAGLGPFLARFLERSGCRVTAVAGRDRDRAGVAAAQLAADLGHPVHACGDAAALCRAGVAAVVIAAPVESHLGALRAAVAAGIPALCEKPLVHETQLADGAMVLAEFDRSGLLLQENCQWPWVLPALERLYGPADRPARHIALGLGPSQPGRAMVRDSLSHLLSLVQALAPVAATTRVLEVSLADPALHAPRNLLRLRLGGAGVDLVAELHLELCPAPPRPAWLAVDGRRMDRRVGSDYAFTFVGNGGEVPVADPMAALVAEFVALVRRPRPESVARCHAAVRERLRLYREVLARIP